MVRARARARVCICVCVCVYVIHTTREKRRKETLVELLNERGAGNRFPR